MFKIRNDYIKYIFTFLLIAWMALIFFMSAKSGDESGDMSNRVGLVIGSVFVPGFEQLTMEEQEAYAQSIDSYVRKSAHAMEYTILGVLACLCFYYYGMKHFTVLGLSLGVVYAALDEFHQLFVPGRSGEIMDVLIDSLGVLLGCMICKCICHYLLHKHMQ